MKKIKNTQKTNFLKKIFIKFCRLIGYEIIDQSNFRSSTLNKDLNETLSIQGKKSITIPLGQIYIKNNYSSNICFDCCLAMVFRHSRNYGNN